MTVEEATSQALEAAECSDPDTLETALGARALAIAALARMDPSPELAQRLASAIEAGDVLSGALAALKVHIRTEGARVAQIQAGLSAGLAAPAATHIDYRG